MLGVSGDQLKDRKSKLEAQMSVLFGGWKEWLKGKMIVGCTKSMEPLCVCVDISTSATYCLF